MAGFVSPAAGCGLPEWLHPVQIRINTDDDEHPKVHRESSNWKSRLTGTREKRSSRKLLLEAAMAISLDRPSDVGRIGSALAAHWTGAFVHPTGTKGRWYVVWPAQSSTRLLPVCY